MEGKYMKPRFRFPAHLSTGDGGWQLTRKAGLADVKADQAIKENDPTLSPDFIKQLQRRNLALLPYLEAGLLVPDAIAAYENDHDDGDPIAL